MAFGVQGVGSNHPLGNAGGPAGPVLPLVGFQTGPLNLSTQQTQQTARIALSAVGQLQGSFLGILGGELTLPEPPADPEEETPAPPPTSSGFTPSNKSAFGLMKQMSGEKPAEKSAEKPGEQTAEKPEAEARPPAPRSLESMLLQAEVDELNRRAEQARKAKEARDLENARDPKLRLSEAMGDGGKAESFLNWLSSDMDAAPGGPSPAQALSQLLGDASAASMLIKARGTMISAGSFLEARLLDSIQSSPTLAAANQKAIADNLSGGGTDYLYMVASDPKLAAGYMMVQATASSSGEGRGAMTDYYRALAGNSNAAAADAKAQESASGSSGGKAAIATLYSNLSKDPQAASAAVQAQPLPAAEAPAPPWPT